MGATNIFANSNTLCDGYLAMFIEFDTKTQRVNIDDYKHHSAKGCGYFLNELNSNLEVRIFDINNVLLKSGKFFISEETFIEKKTKTGKLKRSSGLGGEKVFRLIKVSFVTPKEKMIKLKVYDLKTSKLVGEKILRL